MNITPLSALAVAYIAGVAAARYVNIPFILSWAISLAAIITAAFSINTKNKSAILFLISSAFLGAAMFKGSQCFPSNHISHLVSPRGSQASVMGIITNDPAQKGKVTTFILETQSLNKRETTGKILVKVFKEDNFSYGDRVCLEGSIYRVPYFRISRKINYRDYLKQKKIHAILSVGRESTIEILERGCGNPLKAFALSLKKYFKNTMTKYMSPFPKAVLGAILLGEREDLSKAARRMMIESGTIHIISISGLHAGLAGLITLIILRMMRMPKKACHVVTSFILVIYCLLTGAMAPVVRVTIMSIMLSLAYIIGRDTDAYNTLSAAALLILLFNPQELFDMSFQLSFSSIFFIAWLSPKINRLFKENLFKIKYMRALIMLFSSSFAVWLGLLPLTAYYFNIISFAAILANMVVVPYFTIVIGSGIAFLFLGSAIGPLAPLLQAANEFFIMCLFKFIALTVRIPGAFINTPDIPFFAVISYYLMLAFIFNQARRSVVKN